MGRNSGSSSKSIPTPPPPPPPPPPLPGSLGGNSWKTVQPLASGISAVSLRPSKPTIQAKNSAPTSGPFRLPPATSTVSKKIRPPLPPSSSQSFLHNQQQQQQQQQHPHHHHHSAPPPPPSSNSIRSVPPLVTGHSNVSTKPRSTSQGRNSVTNISSAPFRLPPPASTLPRKIRPPLPPPPPPPSVPPSGFSNNTGKFIPPPPPSLALSNSFKKPAIPPKKNYQNDSNNSFNRSFNSLPTNLESRFRHIFKDLHTLPAPEPFLSTRKHYPSERKPRGPAPPIPSRSTSITSVNHNYYNDSTRYNSTPMIHVQLEHQALGVNYPRY
ncbi:uncharacterized protein LOC128388724 [Panonychus citri]|uniref:uncharacterized protein LOC128388724 n=1 Tax=Panonychus citri TaxID=50023 RepID=UPI002307C6A5|nr:uncharacterized protein LOC128388724 [Panonychus citri]